MLCLATGKEQMAKLIRSEMEQRKANTELLDKIVGIYKKNKWVMILNDKRFWIFEASTIVCSILVNSFVDLIASESVIEFKLMFTGLSCACGVITWLLANGKHWLLFGLIYEIVLLMTIWIFMAILSIGDFHNSSNNAMTMEDWHIIIAFNIGVIFFTLIPTLLLAFFGYQIFRNK